MVKQEVNVFNNKIPNFLFLSILILSSLYINTIIAVGQRGKDLDKPATELEAKLILYKDQYLLREPIWVKVTVTNKGEEEGWFYFARVTGFKIKDSKGEEYPCHVSFSTSGANIIKAGQTLEDETNLLLWYGLPESKYKVWRYLPPEKYTIYYQLDKFAKSQVYHFEIVKPEGNELKAMKLLRDSYNLIVEKKNNEAIDKLNQLITQLPQSVYAPHALWEMAVKYKIFIKNTQETKETYQKLVNDFPHSREAVDALSDLVNTYITQKDETGCISYLNDLIENYPNTDIANEAQKQLEKLDELKLERIK